MTYIERKKISTWSPRANVMMYAMPVSVEMSILSTMIAAALVYARPTSYAYESSALACPPLPVLDQRGPTEWPAATTDARSANALEWAIVAGRPLTSAADYPPKLGGDDDEADADDEFGRDGVEYLETGWGGGAAC